MISLFIALFLTATSAVPNDDSVCNMQIVSGEKITISVAPKYKLSGESQYASQPKGFILKDHKNKYLLSEFNPEFDNSMSKVADSSLSVEEGKNLIHFYHRKINGTPEWFAVITSVECDCKWVAYLEGKDLTRFKEIIGKVRLLKNGN